MNALAELVGRAQPWREQAACRTPRVRRLIAEGLVSFFPERGRSADRARDICADCPVRLECLDAAEPGVKGIWGGTSDADRRRMRGTG